MIRFINGYITTSESDDAPSRMLISQEKERQLHIVLEINVMSEGRGMHLYEFSCASTASPRESWPPRKTTAFVGVTSPLASGLDLVRSNNVG